MWQPLDLGGETLDGLLDEIHEVEEFLHFGAKNFDGFLIDLNPIGLLVGFRLRYSSWTAPDILGEINSKSNTYHLKTVITGGASALDAFWEVWLILDGSELGKGASKARISETNFVDIDKATSVDTYSRWTFSLKFLEFLSFSPFFFLIKAAPTVSFKTKEALRFFAIEFRKNTKKTCVYVSENGFVLLSSAIALEVRLFKVTEPKNHKPC